VGRYSQQHTAEEIAERFEIIDPEFSFPAAIQHRPFTDRPDHHRAGAIDACRLQVGAVPFWAKDPSIANRTINAKSENLAQKPAFKYAVVKRRCLIPADGFYEWQSSPKVRDSPSISEDQTGGLFAFAGFGKAGHRLRVERLRTFTIIIGRAE
jgi:putative SOS response-associated peptidase YedK